MRCAVCNRDDICNVGVRGCGLQTLKQEPCHCVYGTEKIFAVLVLRHALTLHATETIFAMLVLGHAVCSHPYRSPDTAY
jgi:hypothetical protein